MLCYTNVTKGYTNYNKALFNVSCQFQSGKVYALVGPNGSGKSTLMKIGAGLVKPNYGMVTLNDIPIGVETKGQIAYMSTEPFFYDYMKILDVGKYFMDFYPDFDLRRYDELIRFMELDMGMKVKSLSSGMADKLKLAATLSRRAKVIMLDEPLNGIDLLGRDQIMEAIIKSKSPECCLIISSHLLDELEPIIDHILMLKNGLLHLEGDAQELREKNGKSIVELYKEVYASNSTFRPEEWRRS